MRTVRDFNVIGKKVLMRCDFNVPLSSEGEILDDFRIKKVLPTVQYLMDNGAKIILMSHLGRPLQKQNQKFSLKIVASKLESLLGKEVEFLDDCVGDKVKKEVDKMEQSKIVLLENLRFHEGEEKNDEGFAKELSEMGDIYINNAFGICHRAHASVVGVPKFLPAGAGLLLQEEVEVLTALLENPKKPLVALIGGAKAETKLKVVGKISEAADFVLISGLVNKAIIGEKIRLKNPQKVLGPVDEAEDGKDIGPKTINVFKEKIAAAKTIFWNGPFGRIEEEKFSAGTKEIAEAIVQSPAFSVAGGGETIEFINQLGLADKFGYLSTGGGAMLDFLSGSELPGLNVLK